VAPAGALAGLVFTPLGQVYLPIGILGAFLSLVVLVGWRWHRDDYALRTAILALILATVGAFIPFAIWAAVAVMWLAGRRFTFLNPVSGWLPRGESTTHLWLFTAAIAIGAPLALLAWFGRIDALPEVSADLVELTVDLPIPVLAVIGLTFILANSIAEEVAYRGVAYETAASFSSGPWALTSQAIAFGTLHVGGVPAGFSGVILATVYGLALGWLRRRSGGLRLPILAHIVADAAILVIVLSIGP
jgi:hypothetical protein